MMRKADYCAKWNQLIALIQKLGGERQMIKVCDKDYLLQCVDIAFERNNQPENNCAFCSKSKDVCAVDLAVDKLNTKARNLYYTCGFKLAVENETFYLSIPDDSGITGGAFVFYPVI